MSHPPESVPVDCPHVTRQARRDRDAEAIRTGEKTPAQVRRERDLLAARRRGTAARPPRPKTP